jgi:ACS family hexuronate transporter-like MFS transporter
MSSRTGSFRWLICALLFFAATINYIDRQVIGILKPVLQSEFGWTELDYGDIVFAFQLAYAVGYLFAGRVIDRLGTRLGFSLALVIWSLAAMAHAEALTYGPAVGAVLAVVGLKFSASVAGFMAARFCLGLGESGYFPSAIKTVAEWFPKRERALATGLFNAGTNIGAVVTPLVVPSLVMRFGWYWAFVVTGSLGFAWLIVWWLVYDRPDRHPRVRPAELALIQSDPPDPVCRVSWSALVPHRATWGYTIAKFLTDPIWWMYLFWVPDFLSRSHGLSLTQLTAPLMTIYVVADIGSVGGGWLSSTLMSRGWSANSARKLAMAVCACGVIPIAFAARVSSLWGAVAIVSLAAASHQGWSANLYTVASDVFPRKAVGSVTALGGFSGAIGGMLIAKVTAGLLQMSGTYIAVFMIPPAAYLTALAIIHLCAPRLDPVSLE